MWSHLVDNLVQDSAYDILTNPLKKEYLLWTLFEWFYPFYPSGEKRVSWVPFVNFYHDHSLSSFSEFGVRYWSTNEAYLWKLIKSNQQIILRRLIVFQLEGHPGQTFYTVTSVEFLQVFNKFLYARRTSIKGWRLQQTIFLSPTFARLVNGAG